jgi:hypothetical protein
MKYSPPSCYIKASITIITIWFELYWIIIIIIIITLLDFALYFNIFIFILYYDYNSKFTVLCL